MAQDNNKSPAHSPKFFENAEPLRSSETSVCIPINSSRRCPLDQEPVMIRVAQAISGR